MNILFLNSGGFDSVVLAHYLKEENPNAEILGLFFNYNQLACAKEKVCAEKVCSKLNYKFKEIKLPTFLWTNSEFYKNQQYKNNESVELEYRNLIFFSYALSIAKSLNCSKVYSAILKPQGYIDTSKEFLSHIESITKLSGIEFITPFSDCNKVDLIPYVFNNDIKREEFYSCNTLDCKGCPDCKETNEILSLCENNHILKSWSNSGVNSFEFQKDVRESYISEARILINNSCQLNCKHCFYGFKDMIDRPLTNEEYFKVLDECVDIGITNYHFSGKEPLINDRIFNFVSYLKGHYSNKVTYEVVTNGITLPQYAQKIKELGFKKVFLSVDDVCDTQGVRNVSTVKALEAVKSYKIPCQVFIDLHTENYYKIDKIINYLYKTYGIKEFYIRNIQYVGNGKDLMKLSPYNLNTAYNSLLLVKDLPIKIDLALNIHYTYELFNYPFLDLSIAIEDSINNLFTAVGNLRIISEIFCNRYLNQITVTPDGYILGCGTEVSQVNYDKISAGNIRDFSIIDLIRRGKELNIQYNRNWVNKEGCIKFYGCACKPLDR